MKRVKSVALGPERAMVLLCEFWSSMVSQMRSHVVPCDSDADTSAKNFSSVSLRICCQRRGKENCNAGTHLFSRMLRSLIRAYSS